MEKAKKTYQDISEFYNSARIYLQSHEEPNKLRYALTRTVKSAARALGDYNEKLDDINIDFCLAADDGKGAILRDGNGQYQFTKEGSKKRNEARRKLFQTPVELDVHFATEVPKDLSENDLDNFVGFVIREPAPEISVVEKAS